VKKPAIPADITAEAQILGAILYDQRHLSALSSKLRPESFFSEAHRQVFAAIRELHDDRVDVNPTTVANLLRGKKRLQQLTNGAAFLDALVDGVPVLTPSTFEALTKTILDRATQRTALVALQQAQARFSDPAMGDVSGALAEVEREILGITMSLHETGGLQHLKVALREEIAAWGERAMGRSKPGIATGFRDYDEWTGGLHRSDLVIVAARPAMGKTAWVTNVITNVAKTGEAAAIFSLEMPKNQMAARILCAEAAIPILRTRTGKLTPRDFTQAQVALSELAGAGIYIDDAAKGRPYVADIVARSRRLAAELARDGKRLGCIVVDYLQIVKLREALLRQRHDIAIGEVSTELKSLAKELDTTVIALSQLNRSVESRQDKRPSMADIRESGQIEQDADQIVMLYRDEYYYPDTTKEPGVVELIIEKQRNGPTGTVKIKFDGPTTRFDNIEHSDHEYSESA